MEKRLASALLQEISEIDKAEDRGMKQWKQISDEQSIPPLEAFRCAAIEQEGYSRKRQLATLLYLDRVRIATQGSPRV